MRPPKHDPTKPHCFLTQCPLNPEASRTIVSEEAPGDRVSMHAPGPPQDSLERDGKSRPNLPLHWTMLGQLCAAPWIYRSRPAATEPGLEPGSVVAQLATVMQCFRPLRHLGGPYSLEGVPTYAEHCWLLFLHSTVQLIPNHLNWVEVG